MQENRPRAGAWIETKLEDTTSWSLLHTFLSFAVPLWIDHIRSWDEKQRYERAKICAQKVAEHGDDIQFRSKKKGETAKAVNHLAEGLAILSFQPGGVSFFGLKFETKE